jgi:hypothetical protein
VTRTKEEEKDDEEEEEEADPLIKFDLVKAVPMILLCEKIKFFR